MRPPKQQIAVYSSMNLPMFFCLLMPFLVMMACWKNGLNLLIPYNAYCYVSVTTTRCIAVRTITGLDVRTFA